MLEQLTSSELRGVALRWRIHKKLKKLENTLSKIQAVLIDAENKQMKDIKVEKWLDDLKHVAYDVEDILDKVSTEALRQKLEAEAKIKQVRKKLIPYNLRPRVVSFKFGIVSKISTINKELEEIALERDRLGLQEGVGAESVRVEQRRPTSSLLNESLVYGREEDKAKIIKLLLSDEHNHNGALVIPIVGMPGVGKTTLAQLVYNGDSVKQYFDLKAWVYVSEGYNMLTLTKAILESATGQSCNLNELDSLQANLKKELKDKKFLLVLDEVWNENYNDWCALLSPFRGGIQESKIIVTTRSETVSSVVGNVHAYKLNVLSEKDCFLLFKQHAFVDGISETNPNLEELGRGIVGKCNGLPLAAKTLGGLLHSKVDVNEWRNILESELWELPEDRSEILPALRLSYHHLPAHLKRCFAYCSIFPKGYEFEETLVFLWMAEGFVQPNERKHMEDIAGDHNTSMFMMHDLMNDLAQSISGGTCFRLEDGNKSNNRANKIPEKARHSSFLRGQYDRITKFQAFHELKLLRTFLPLTRREDKYCYIPKQILHDLFPKLTCLRVLSLRWYYITQFPDSIGQLKHLRYLDFSHTPIRRLPDSTNALYNLQSLILNCWPNLIELPKDMGNLINLRHLKTSECPNLEKMPMGFGRLTNLRTLSNFVVSQESPISELGKISHLQGNIHISNRANLKDKLHIQGLKLEWSGASSFHEDVLRVLQPHMNLKELFISSYLGEFFPSWIGDQSLSNLVILKLFKCSKCKSLPPLGQLPMLKDLYIEGMHRINCVGREFYGDCLDKTFPSLEILSFREMLGLVEWFGLGEEKELKGIEEFPNLTKLTMQNCPKLQKLSPCFPALVSLEVKDCKALIALPKLLPSSVSTDQPSKRFKKGQRSSSERGDELTPHLCELVIGDCLKLREAPFPLPFMTKLEIRGCSVHHFYGQEESNKLLLEGFAEITSLNSFHISEFVNTFPTGISSSHDCTRRLRNLLKTLPELPLRVKFLHIEHCYGLRELPHIDLLTELRSLSIIKCGRLQYLPQGLNNLRYLEHLEIKWCSSIESFPCTGLPIKIERLEIKDCRVLKLPVQGLHNLTSLKYLIIEECYHLKSLSRAWLPTSLEHIEFRECENLNNLPEDLNQLSCLYHLEVNNCPALVDFPEEGLPVTSLRSVWIIGCKNLKFLPNHMNSLASLHELRIWNCPKIVSFPQGGLPANLYSLSIKDCNYLKLQFDWGLHDLTSLRYLMVAGCPELFSSLDWQLQLMTLTSLHLERCENLIFILRGLKNLTSLEELVIIKSNQLKSLREIGVLTASLSRLDIQDCPLLKQQFQDEEDRPKIAHISCIEIDGENIT
uniref:Disease resistance RPP13-like protein 1 n=1 Tax=Nelumbo nucifera TaxID=4432 RepID=A0A822ZGC4_NELNU|nr:TPA_asm: hypothetical protein HUJ06_000715 [Nelumbo nucifera]